MPLVGRLKPGSGFASSSDQAHEPASIPLPINFTMPTSASPSRAKKRVQLVGAIRIAIADAAPGEDAVRHARHHRAAARQDPAKASSNAGRRRSGANVGSRRNERRLTNHWRTLTSRRFALRHSERWGIWRSNDRVRCHIGNGADVNERDRRLKDEHRLRAFAYHRIERCGEIGWVFELDERLCGVFVCPVDGSCRSRLPRELSCRLRPRLS